MPYPPMTCCPGNYGDVQQHTPLVDNASKLTGVNHNNSSQAGAFLCIYAASKATCCWSQTMLFSSSDSYALGHVYNDPPLILEIKCITKCLCLN